MSTQIAVRESRKVERETKLTQLAEVANRAHDVVVEAAREAVLRALEAGRALAIARDLCPKGTWTAWLAGNFGGSPSAAHDYIRVAQYVAELGDDPQCVAGFSYNEVKRIIAGRFRSTGRKPARRLSNGTEPAPATLIAPELPSAPSQPPTGEAAVTVVAPMPAADRLDPFVQMLQQAVAELRRLIRDERDEASYARHLLPPLERICGGVATRTWFWDLTDR